MEVQAGGAGGRGGRDLDMDVLGLFDAVGEDVGGGPFLDWGLWCACAWGRGGKGSGSSRCDVRCVMNHELRREGKRSRSEM